MAKIGLRWRNSPTGKKQRRKSKQPRLQGRVSRQIMT